MITTRWHHGHAGCPALAACLLVVFMSVQAVCASDLEEFRVKRAGPFEFAEEPRATRRGDRVTIRFKARAFCDATVAIERASAGSGRAPEIIRYLACGVLGPNAPE
ncbi:MAG: hypothetical protein ACOC70_02200, partial [bacterium]